MTKAKVDLGRLVSIHGTSPVFLQRAAIVAALSFVFFMSTLLIFYIQHQVMYFILSSAFLVIYIFTMIGWVMQKRNAVSIFENGITYRKFAAKWGEIQAVRSDARQGIQLVKDGGETITISRTIADADKIAVAIRKHLP